MRRLVRYQAQQAGLETAGDLGVLQRVAQRFEQRLQPALALGQLPGELADVEFARRQLGAQNGACAPGADQVPRSRHQLAYRERLGQPILHARGQYPHAHLDVIASGQNQNRDIDQLLFGAQGVHEFVAAHVRHHEIGHDQVGHQML